MYAVCAEDCRRVVGHLSLKIVYLFAYDTQGRTNLAPLESLAVIDILNMGLDDMPVCLTYVGSLLAH